LKTIPFDALPQKKNCLIFSTSANARPSPPELTELFISEPPQILEDSAGGEIKVMRGSLVTMKCKASGYPAPEVQIYCISSSPEVQIYKLLS